VSVYTFKKFVLLLSLCVIVGFAFVEAVRFGVNVQQRSAGTPMPETVDVFRGSFSPSNRISVAVNQTVEIAFSIKPIEDVKNATIRIMLPGDLIRLVTGDLEWRGDLRKDEEVQLSFSVQASVEMNANVRAFVEGYISGYKMTRSYYLEISTGAGKTPESPLIEQITLKLLLESKPTNSV